MNTNGQLFYDVVVEFHVTDDKGHDKKITEKYLIEAVSCTDAEVIANTNFKSSASDFKVSSVRETKYIDVLNKDSEKEE